MKLPAAFSQELKICRAAWLLIALAALVCIAAESRVVLAQAPTPTAVASTAVAPYIIGGPFVVSLPSHDSDGDGVNDAYGPTDVIEVAYHLSEISCGGDSALTFVFQTGGGQPEFRRAEYGGCGGAYDDVPDRIIFKHAVTAGDMDGDGFGIAANSLYLKPYEGDGTTIANPAFSAGPLHKVDGDSRDVAPPRLIGAPSVANYPRDGNAFREGESVEVRMVFTEDVIVDAAGGNPTVDLRLGKLENAGAEVVKAEYTDLGIERSRHLVFSYEVQAGDKNDDGIIWVQAGSITVPPGSSISDLAGNRASVVWKTSSGSEFGIDGVSPMPCAALILDELTSLSCDIARSLETGVVAGLIVVALISLMGFVFRFNRGGI